MYTNNYIHTSCVLYVSRSLSNYGVVEEIYTQNVENVLKPQYTAVLCVDVIPRTASHNTHEPNTVIQTNYTSIVSTVERNIIKYTGFKTRLTKCCSGDFTIEHYQFYMKDCLQ